MNAGKILINDYITDIYSEESISQRFCIYKKNISKLGFDVITYVLVPQEKLKAVSSVFPLFLSQSGFHYTIDKCYKKEYNDGYFLFIPTASNNKVKAGAIVCLADADMNSKELPNDTIQLLGYYTKLFHDISFSNISINNLLADLLFRQLSDKEKGVIRHLASGKRFKNITYSIDVASYRVASNMLDKLRKKFGNISRDRLMYLAGLMNFE